MKKKIIVVIVVILILVSLAVSAVAFLRYKGYILPGYISWQERTLNCDGYDIILSQKHISVYKNGECVWETDKSVKVQDVILLDADRDGVTEMTLLCWKKGRYGKATPAFGDKDDKNVYSEHIYLYDLGTKKPAPKWMASDIGAIVLSIDTPNGYILATHERDGSVSEWQWVSWGFVKVK